MRVFFDTQFYEDGVKVELISLGMVREDGATLYVETDMAWVRSGYSDWLKENVRPHLRNAGREPDDATIAAMVRDFAGPSPEFWAYYADYDWLALCQLYGRMIDLPAGWPMYARDLQQAIDLAGRGKPPEQTRGQHDALEDALWTRDAWIWLRDATNGGEGLLVPRVAPWPTPAPATAPSGTGG